MTTRKNTKQTAAKADLDPTALANLNVLKRQRERANRLLLKKRQKKSGQ